MSDKEAILAALDESIAIVQRHRDAIAVLPDEILDNWRVCKRPMLCDLLQFSRSSEMANYPGAKELARALGTDWLDDRGGKWGGTSLSHNKISLVLHNAYRTSDDSRRVEL